jgi:hypothetical protein
MAEYSPQGSFSTAAVQQRESLAAPPHTGHGPGAVARHVQAIGGRIQISAVFGDDHYVLRGTVTEAA